MAADHFDVIVLGAGSGGLSMAIRSAKHGARVALLDPGELGGTCVNVGCIPKKAMWLAAELVNAQRTAVQLGFDSTVGPLDWPAFIERRERYIGNIHASYQRQLDELGIERFAEYGRIKAVGLIEAGGRELSAPHIVIATGARAARPDLPGAELGIDSNGFFALRAAPSRVALIGGGYIAVELAGVLRALGSEVSLVLRGEHLLPNFDRDCADHLTEIYQAHGVAVHGNVEVTALQRGAGGVRIVGRAAPDSDFDCVIWATGRQPLSADLGLDSIGVKLDKRAHVIVDELQHTNVPGIYAVGDVSTDLALTPVAVRAGRCLAERLFNQCADSKLDRRLIPTVIFGHPPMASVGMSEAEARKAHGDAVHIYTSRFRPIIGALAGQPDQTLMKLICAGAEERVVGLHMVGAGVDEMLQGFALAMKLGACKADFDQVVAIHPTAAEEIVLMGERRGKGK